MARKQTVLHKDSPQAHRQTPAQAASGMELLRQFGIKSISVDIPPTATYENVVETLQTLVNGVNAANAVGEQLKPIIGRTLLAIRDRQLFKTGGFKNFNQFMIAVPMGQMKLGRSAAFDALRIASKFPQLSVDEYNKYGVVRLIEAIKRKVTPADKPEGWREELDEMASKGVTELLEESKQIRAGRAAEADRHMIVVREPKAVVDAWQEYAAQFESVHEAFAHMLKLAMAQKVPHARKKAA